jgi:hypothetical protein
MHKPAAGGAIRRVVIMVQENHTTDNYFRALAAYGANVVHTWPTAPNPPTHDPPHDRHAYYRWLTHSSTGAQLQFDTIGVLPFYAYLALTGAFLENHCSGFGTNSTPNHLLIVGGQSPTLRNPPRNQPQPLWDMPSLPALAARHGIAWRCYAGTSQYPFLFYKELHGSPNIKPSAQIVADARAGTLPPLVFLYHDSPLDEHPTADVRQGMHSIWEVVDAVVQGGGWDETLFLLTWDDWGGWDDHVATPAVEYTPDNVQVAFGPRVPLLMFGGRVRHTIDSRWCSHVSIPRTAMQLLGLPALGVPRLDNDPGLADLVSSSVQTPQPPALDSKIVLPTPPHPVPPVHPLPPPPVARPIPIPPVVLNGGGQLPPPNDVPLPHQAQPPKAALHAVR